MELRLADYDAKLAHMAGLKAYCREKLLAMGGVVPVGEGTAPHILPAIRGRPAMWSPLWDWTKRLPSA